MTKTRGYGKIVEGYDAARKREFSRFVTYPSFRKLVGNIRGQDALDIGCGAGFSTRILKELGAIKLIGLDITSEQIALAKKYESTSPLGIEYYVADISRADLSRFGKFDLITSVHCINHCTLEELAQAIKHVSCSMKPTGRFVGIMTSPDLTAKGYDNYGIKYSFPQGFGDTKPVHAVISAFSGEKFCELTENYYNFKTFRRLFLESGLSVEWSSPSVTKEGLKEKGKEFWRDLLNQPPVLLFEALKLRRKL